ncbi:MAG: TIGR02677 family protein [Cellulosilyticum sp.]|nr:TIGR02677 family protein [Cellulosilyticum sp.]
MKLNPLQTKTIDETRYLSTENTWRYRSIMRVMYKQYEKMKYWSFKEEIFEALKLYDEFEHYTLDQMKLDLDQLTMWNNITAIADTTKVKTVEEFKNRTFRYQISTYSIEIERMLIGLEQMRMENKSNLEHALVERFYHLLAQHESVLGDEDKKVYEWWKSLNSAFKELNQSYRDYIGMFYSPKTEELMKAAAFLVFKEAFIRYLRDFIREIQMSTRSIKEIFMQLTEEEQEKLLEKVLNYEKSIVNMEIEIKDEEYLEINRGRFQSMEEWFVSKNGIPCLVERLIDSTNEIIRKMTRFAAQIADKRNNNVNRKEEYRRIAQLFTKCEDIEEAHKLAAMVFGSIGTMHIKCKEERETESHNSSTFDEAPQKVTIRPKVRTYREKLIKNPIIDKTQLKEEKRQELLKRRKEEEQSVERFIEAGEIDFARLSQLKTRDRQLLLKWLTKGKGSKKGWVKTETGLVFKVEVASHESIILHCEDGDFTMPYYKICFREEE